ncbi:Uma2 family endonuclease [Phytoactinopolyspora halophila]|nr:Uma2 family endonuclease [Phytoactinopolyspora halophila]
MVAEAIDPMDSIFAHEGPWTEDEYLALPAPTGQRTELIDGELVMSPVGDASHQNLGQRLWRELDRELPDEYVPFHEANVRLSSGRIVIPDVVVTTDQSDWLVVDAAEVVMVSEVVSPSSLSIDRILKPTLFAEAGIPWYLRIEREAELMLILQRRKGGGYVEHASVAAGQRLDLPDLGCSIDVDALLRRRG